jgi:transcriptional regulator with XRE-family HTH domain
MPPTHRTLNQLLGQIALGAFLEQARTRAGYSRNRLAKLIEESGYTPIPERTIVEYESGGSTPHATRLDDLCATLNLDVTYALAILRYPDELYDPCTEWDRYVR